MYDELIKRLRVSADNHHEKCDGCPYEEDYPCCVDCFDKMHKEAADAIEKMSEAYDKLSRHMDDLAALFPRWIPVSERLPETGVDVLVKFPQNMAVASIDIVEWVVNSGDGWCTDINLAGGEKNPTHWMPLPQPPEEEAT